MPKHRKDEVPKEEGEKAVKRVRDKIEQSKTKVVEDASGYSIQGKTTRKVLKNQKDGTTDTRDDHR
jgi:hypothetical protein